MRGCGSMGQDNNTFGDSVFWWKLLWSVFLFTLGAFASALNVVIGLCIGALASLAAGDFGLAAQVFAFCAPIGLSLPTAPKIRTSKNEYCVSGVHPVVDNCYLQDEPYPEVLTRKPPSKKIKRPENTFFGPENLLESAGTTSCPSHPAWRQWQ